VRRLTLLVLLAVGLFVVAGCGNKEDVVTFADTEGVTVQVGGLDYQVQISRYLNPHDPEDKQYLMGLPQGTAVDPGGSEIWFGVWMRVKNYSGRTATPTSNFTITDTENDSFEPVPLNASINPFAYDPTPLLHAQVLPEPDTAAASGPIQGSLILFRLKTASIQNRPLLLHIAQGPTESATVSLDL
jgi:hypothetical protein